jgi:hypothetical protein
MRHGFTLFFLAWGGVLIVMALVKVVQGNALSEEVPVCVMGLIGIALAAGTWHFIGQQQQLAREQPPQAPAAVEQPAMVVRPPASIELHQSGGSVLSLYGYALCFLFAAGWLVRYPDTLRTGWLSYPAAAVMLVLAVGAVLIALSQRDVRYVADANGIEIRRPQTSERVAWKDVATVKEVERWRKRYRSALTDFLGRHLAFEDREGEELLRLEDVAPAEAYQRLLESIPAWTGHPVQHETEGLRGSGGRTPVASQKAAESVDIVTTQPVEGAVLVRRMAAHLLTALSVWLGAVVLLSVAGIVFLHDFKYALTIGLLRFGSLFWKCLLMVLAAELVLWLAHYGWVNDEPGPGWFSKMVNFVFGAVPVALAGLGAISLIGGEDPWQALPGGPPFALREFAARHPQLRIETVGILGGNVVAVTRGASRNIMFSVWDLLGAEMAWEECADAKEPERLGGPPPFPASRCLARIRIRKPDDDALTDEQLDRGVVPPDIHNVKYVYSGGGADPTEVKAHFENWAKSDAINTSVKGHRRYIIEATAAGKSWTIEIRGRKYTVDDVYIEYTDKPARPAPTEKDE